jgi:integrase
VSVFDQPVTARGETLPLSEWARRLGCGPSVVYQRIQHLGWDAERAVTTPVAGRRTVTYQGETLPVKEWARRLGLSPKLIKNRLDAGWPPEKALGTVADLRRDSTPGGVARRRLQHEVPRMLHHKTSGQAYARVGRRGRVKYFGKWGSDEAARAYGAWAREWLDARAAEAADEPVVVDSTPPGGRVALVSDLAKAWLARCEKHYVKNGKPTSEVGCHKIACGMLVRVAGQTRAAQVRPADLEACRQLWVEKGTVRASINSHLWRLKSMFRWAADNGLIPDAVADRLARVKNLKRGQAPEGKPVKPAAAEALEKVKPHLPGWARAVLELQLATGMRPGEACAMREDDVDRSGKTWLYRVRDEVNKNAHRDQALEYHLGPRARAAIGPFLEAAGPGGYLFRADRGRHREHVAVHYYREVLGAACVAAGVAHVHPHQVRHTRATEVRKAFGFEAVSLMLGNGVDMTERYAERDAEVIRRIAEETG